MNEKDFKKARTAALRLLKYRIRSKDELIGSIPLRHLAWRTDKQWISEFRLQSVLVADACVILDVVPGTEPQYKINLKDWIEESEQHKD